MYAGEESGYCDMRKPDIRCFRAQKMWSHSRSFLERCVTGSSHGTDRRQQDKGRCLLPGVPDRGCGIRKGTVKHEDRLRCFRAQRLCRYRKNFLLISFV